MKLKITLLLLICFSKIYSQKIEKKIGEIKIMKESYYFKDYKKSKKRKTEKSAIYFDGSGKILEKIKYGNNHTKKLNVIGEIEQYTYLNNKLELLKKYVSDCSSCGFYLYYSKYKYDFDDKLISGNTFRGENDSLFSTTSYSRKPNIREIHFNDSTYYENKYDNENRIIEQNQVFEKTNKIRWQFLYEYRDNCRIGTFQTYYGDGNENFKKEITCFDLKKRKITEEITNYNKIKIFYNYSENGLINEIEEFEKLTEYEDYKLIRSTKIKVNRKSKNLTPEIIIELNSTLI